jgi:hypothetical protein
MGFWRNLERSIDQFVDFQPTAYKCEIAPLNETQLRALHKRIQRKVVGAVAGAGLSAWAVPATAGLSLIGTGIAARRIDVNRQRCDIIEERLREKGWHGNDFGLGDIAWGVAPVGLAAALAPGADHFVDQAATHLATHIAAHHGTNHLVDQAASHVVTHTAGNHGTRHLIDRAATHVQHMAGDHAAGVDMVIASTNPTMANELIYKTTHTVGERMAETAGKWTAHKVAEKGVGLATGYAVSKVSDIVPVKPHVPSSSSSNKPYRDSARPSAEYTRKPAGQPSAPPPSPDLKPVKSHTLSPIKTKPCGGVKSNYGSLLSDSNSKLSTTSDSTTQLPDPVVEADRKLSNMMRLAVILLPATIYSTFGETVFWFTCVSGVFLALISRGKIAISAFLVPALLLLFSNANHLWVISVSLAVLDFIGWGVLLLVAKVVLYLLMLLLTFVLVFACVTLLKPLGKDSARKTS